MGTASGLRTRRYHGLLVAATRPPAGRMMLVNGFDAGVETPGGLFALSSQAYAPDVIHPDGAKRITEFTVSPWPRWRYALEDGTEIEHEVVMAHGAPVTLLRWRLLRGRGNVALFVRPFLSGRDYHALHRENPAFRFVALLEEGRVTWRPYDGVPAVTALTSGRYTHEPSWYRSFLYEEEVARGLDFLEDLAAPGFFRFDLSDREAVLVLAAEGHTPTGNAETAADQLLSRETARRERFATPLVRAADTYIVARGTGKTIVAGYPWFTDWGRDTFIALRGLCLTTGRLDDAHAILEAWAGAVSDGMLPNRFPDAGPPEYNSVDSALWFVVAVDAFVKRSRKRTPSLWEAVEAILAGHARGTGRHGIHVGADGLLAAGEPGWQLTWMDAKDEGAVVTPRMGKPVEIQALWINALTIGSARSPRWTDLADRARAAFRARFWNPDLRCLYDVVDPDDPTIRPNQIFAVGGLPLCLVEDDQARAVVTCVEERLVTPLGLRTLAPAHPSYAGKYDGGPKWRDRAYHQGTVWPWLLGPFVEAWLRVHGNTPDTRRDARKRFLTPMLDRLAELGHTHVPEVADGDAPHVTRGCPFQAWSVGEILRLDREVLA